MAEFCPCGKSTSYAACCGRFIDDGEIAKTPEQLMRSRFTAYALGNKGEYLLATWFPATAKGLSADDLSLRRVNWQKLEVINKSQQADTASVEFKAYFSPRYEDGENEVMHEISEFTRVKGRWYYVGGRVE
jgi:SEC-C motif-containing protein